MSHSIFPKITFGIAILFVCGTIPAFAQRGGGGGGSHGGGGGGGGGGGFHGGGGGGFHGGGGGGSHASGGARGGGFRSGASSPGRAGAYSRSMSGMSSRFGTGPSARSGSYGSSFSGDYGRSSGGGRASTPSSLARSVADGQWHSFGSVGTARGSTASEAQSRGSTGSSWQTFGGARSVGGARTTRSFSGQGNQIWENAPIARNAGPSRTFSNVRGNLNGLGAFRNSSRLGAPFMSRRGFGFRGFRGHGGCWDCGFGFGWGFGLGWWPGWGFNWGWGWPWFGYWNWGPAWIDPVWGWPGYDYNGYPAGYAPDYPYDDNSYSAPADDNSYSTPAGNDQGNDAGAPSDVQAYSPSTADNRKTEMPVLLYMKDRSVFAASDCWVEQGKLHYVLSTGAEKMVDLDQVDVKRTISGNADLGTQVNLKPRAEPSS